MDSNLQKIQNALIDAGSGVSLVDAELQSQADLIASVPGNYLRGTLGFDWPNLHRLPAMSQETLFAWFQAGNVGNTGGGSKQSHGRYTWLPAVGSIPALLSIIPEPAAANGITDNFYTYMLLPMPSNLPSQITHSYTVKMSAADQDNNRGWEAEWQLDWQG